MSTTLTAGELRRLLELVPDDTPVYVSRTRYNGHSDQTSIDDAEVWHGQDCFVITDSLTSQYDRDGFLWGFTMVNGVFE